MFVIQACATCSAVPSTALFTHTTTGFSVLPSATFTPSDSATETGTTLRTSTAHSGTGSGTGSGSGTGNKVGTVATGTTSSESASGTKSTTGTATSAAEKAMIGGMGNWVAIACGMFGLWVLPVMLI